MGVLWCGAFLGGGCIFLGFCFKQVEMSLKQERQFYIELCFSFLNCSAYFYVLPFMSSKSDLQTAIRTLLKKGPGLQDAKQSQFIAFRR